MHTNHSRTRLGSSRLMRLPAAAGALAVLIVAGAAVRAEGPEAITTPDADAATRTRLQGGGGEAGRSYPAYHPPRSPWNGSLDASFGIGGRLMIAFDPLEGAAADSLALQPDGRIIAGGYTDLGFTLLRFLPDGTMDVGFGAGGRASPGTIGGAAVAVAVQPDGRIVAASGGRQSRFALARFMPDGDLDGSFGSEGVVVTDLPGDSEAIRAIALQPDGRIVAAGSAGGFAVARYNPDGTLDATFGAGGVVITDVAAGADHAAALALQPDGRIVVAGSAGGPASDFALARYNPGGTLDATFGAGGLVTTDFAGGADDANGVVLLADGTIVAAGSAAGASRDFALVAYRTDGSLEPGFGGRGLVTTDFQGSEDAAQGIALTPEGRIVVAGWSRRDVTYEFTTDFALAGYNVNGRLDPTFGTAGRITTDFAGAEDAARAVVVQPDGRAVAAGVGTIFLSQRGPLLAIARYSKCNGANPNCDAPR